MTQLRIIFAGPIKNVQHRTAGAHQVTEFGLVKTHKGKDLAEATWTHIRVTLWDAKGWQKELLVEGAFVAGTGDVELRSYEKKDGSKGHSMEVRCGSFDVEVQSDGNRSAERAPVTEQRPMAPIGGGAGSEETPF